MGCISPLNPQANTIEVLLNRARMLDCNPVPFPCQSGVVFSKKHSPDPATTRATEYSSHVALANFLADIAFIVNKLCKFMSNPGEIHFQMLKFLLRYLKGTKSKGLLFQFNQLNAGVQGVHGYADASHADCPDTSRSTLAHVFFYGGAILAWHSKLHTHVTTCTNHSEYAALFVAQWLEYLFKELVPGETQTPIPIFVDSSGVVSMVFNPVDHQSNKHVRLAYHYARELTAEKIILPQRIPSDDNLADYFTKPLSGPRAKQILSRYVSERQ